MVFCSLGLGPGVWWHKGTGLGLVLLVLVLVLCRCAALLVLLPLLSCESQDLPVCCFASRERQMIWTVIRTRAWYVLPRVGVWGGGSCLVHNDSMTCFRWRRSTYPKQSEVFLLIIWAIPCYVRHVLLYRYTVMTGYVRPVCVSISILIPSLYFRPKWCSDEAVYTKIPYRDSRYCECQPSI